MGRKNRQKTLCFYSILPRTFHFFRTAGQRGAPLGTGGAPRLFFRNSSRQPWTDWAPVVLLRSSKVILNSSFSAVSLR